MANKKPTIKEIEAKVADLTRIHNQVTSMMDSLGNAFKFYIEFKGDTKDFQEYYNKRVEEIRGKIIKGGQ